MLRGIPIILYNVELVDVDPFGAPIYEEVPEVVWDCLVAPMSDDEIIDTLNLTGRRAVYQIALPKGDAHDWTNRAVRFFGELWRVIGHGTEGIEEMIPLRWNRKIKVESLTPEEHRDDDLLITERHDVIRIGGYGIVTG